LSARKKIVIKLKITFNGLWYRDILNNHMANLNQC